MHAKPLREDRARSLEMFVAVAAHESFTGAARVLDLTPSAVSRAIDRLENRLGARLVLRSTRGVSLTQEGHSYLCGARRILTELDNIEHQLTDRESPRGRLRVSASLGHARKFIVPLIRKFLELHEGIVLEMDFTDRLVDIAGGEADVAIRFGKLADSRLTARKLAESDRVIVAAPSYLDQYGTPRRPEDLRRHNCLKFSFRRAEPAWPFREDERHYEIDVRGNVEVDNGDTLVQLAHEGVGVARVGAFAVQEDIDRGRLVPLLEEFNPGDKETVHAVFVGGHNIPARLRVFVDFLAARLGARAGELQLIGSRSVGGTDSEEIPRRFG